VIHLLNRAPRALIAAVLVAISFGVAVAGAPQKDTVPASEWPLVGRTDDNQYFSPLRQINDKTVSRLGLAWYVDIPSKPGLVGTPIVVDGVVYQSAQRSVVFANDVRTGRLLWTYDPKLKFDGEIIPSMGSAVNRGVGVWKDKVYVGTADCRLIALNRLTGKPVWEADVCVGDPKFAITGAPKVGGGKVFIGPANLDDGSRRGFLDAYDAATGKRLWRFYTIPGDPSKGFENKQMEMAAKTWGKDYWKRAGAGSVIEGITYDSQLKLVYFGTTSATPEAPPDRGEGRNGELFTASIIAVDAETGEYRWHYQQTPNNGWNYDSYQPITIATLPIGGKQRRVLLHAPKNGFFYVLDAATGKLLSGDKYGVRVNWASNIDPKTGKPVEMLDAQYWVNGRATIAYPSSYGAHNWMPMAFSPLTGLVYIPAVDMGSDAKYAPKTGDNVGFALSDASVQLVAVDTEDAKAPLIAWDPVKRKVQWSKVESLPIGGGTLATAGNLVFYGRGDGLLRAFAADTGEVLWSVKLDGAVRAAPVTVEVDGEQVLLIASGSDGSSGGGVAMGNVNTTEATRQAPARLLAFKLGAKGALPTTDLRNVFQQPPRPRPDPDDVKRGHEIVSHHACDFCHGHSFAATTNVIPDLRKANAATHDALRQIVIGGAYKTKGMPQFEDITPADLELIRAYILDRAWAAYDAQQAANAASEKH
jgi:quinohemoprotein ethanol dehydrogenase